jgi:hypothetical protein
MASIIFNFPDNVSIPKATQLLNKVVTSFITGQITAGKQITGRNDEIEICKSILIQLGTDEAQMRKIFEGTMQ